MDDINEYEVYDLSGDDKDKDYHLVNNIQLALSSLSGGNNSIIHGEIL